MSKAEDGLWKRALSAYTRFHWVMFNFMARRVLAVAFIVVGLLISVFNAPVLLPGGTIPVNGVPEDDLVLRLVSVFMPLLVAALGVALFRSKPYDPD